jgi:hypothetical protein
LLVYLSALLFPKKHTHTWKYLFWFLPQ